LEYSNNWAEKNFSSSVYLVNIDSIIFNDTSGNLIGTNPGLVAPTLTHSVSESALSADFRLLATSPCIDKGIASIYAGTMDYINNDRTSGSAIDIGAYEYGSSPYTLVRYPNETERLNTMKIYPNPAKEMLFVTTPSATGVLQLQDISGKLLAEKPICSTVTKFDTQSIPRGLYVMVWHDTGHNCEVQKVVVE